MRQLVGNIYFVSLLNVLVSDQTCYSLIWYPNISTHVSLNKIQRHESTFSFCVRLKNEKLFYARRSVLSVKKVSVNETRSVFVCDIFFLLFCSKITVSSREGIID